jgi:hypothetical protein
MNSIFNDLVYSRRKMTDEVVPNLLERGRKLTELDDSLQILVMETDTFQANAGRLNERKDRYRITLGLCCLILCVLTVAWYFLAAAAVDERIRADSNQPSATSYTRIIRPLITLKSP